MAQFSLRVAVNAPVGTMVGQERTGIPLLAGEVFELDGVPADLSSIASVWVVAGITALSGWSWPSECTRRTSPRPQEAP